MTPKTTLSRLTNPKSVYSSPPPPNFINGYLCNSSRYHFPKKRKRKKNKEKPPSKDLIRKLGDYDSGFILSHNYTKTKQQQRKQVFFKHILTLPSWNFEHLDSWGKNNVLYILKDSNFKSLLYLKIHLHILN